MINGFCNCIFAKLCSTKHQFFKTALGIGDDFTNPCFLITGVSNWMEIHQNMQLLKIVTWLRRAIWKRILQSHAIQCARHHSDSGQGIGTHPIWSAWAWAWALTRSVAPSCRPRKSMRHGSSNCSSATLTGSLDWMLLVPNSSTNQSRLLSALREWATRQQLSL